MERREPNWAPLIVALVLSLASGAVWAFVTWLLGSQLWWFWGLFGTAGAFVALCAVMSSEG